MSSYDERQRRLQAIFQDTMHLVETNPLLSKVTAPMVVGTQIYTHPIEIIRPTGPDPGHNISVVEDTTFHCASRYAKRTRTAVLNFANSIHPGGGVVHGAVAQEECLCRSSNLYAGLTSAHMIEQYYRWNQSAPKRYGSNSVAYHPQVTVFKDDELYANLMPESDWFQVDVITCAAPCVDIWDPLTDDEMYRIHVERGRRILHAAVANRVQILILGAFGCGAFGNDPAIVAKAYRHLLVDEGYASFFLEVTFAIKKNRKGTPGNYYHFQKVLESI